MDMDTREEFEKIKIIIQKIIKTKLKNKLPLTDEQNIVGNEVGKISLELFSKLKLNNAAYTVNGNKALKKMNIDEDSDGISEVSAIAFFKDNTEAFHEIIANYFMPNKKNYAMENHIFYLEIYSKLNCEYNDIYFVNKKGQFYIYIEKIEEILLIDYLRNYYGDVPQEISERITELLKNKKVAHEELQNEITELGNKINEANISNPYEFQHGAITFMDFLGWKGLWQSKNGEHTNHLETVSQLIGKFEEKVQELTGEEFAYSKGMRISKLLSISDTIAIFTPKITSLSKLQLLHLHARIVKYILEESVNSGYPIRGAIAYGKYNIKNSIMIGPGIDECASWHETCNWIGVHFTPSAQFIICGSPAERDDNLIDEYPRIPVKPGVPKITYCVNWTVNDINFNKLTYNAQALLPEIASKYMNTFDYLNRVKEG